MTKEQPSLRFSVRSLLLLVSAVAAITHFNLAVDSYLAASTTIISILISFFYSIKIEVALREKLAFCVSLLSSLSIILLSYSEQRGYLSPHWTLFYMEVSGWAVHVSLWFSGISMVDRCRQLTGRFQPFV
ncbi:MAG: hypothetical protein ACI9HK_005152 [Pirellulaceae bacterium]|jgi:hypothetical protein